MSATDARVVQPSHAAAVFYHAYAPEEVPRVD